MKNFLLIIAVSLCLVGSVFGQIETTIFNVQDTTGGPGGGDSKLLDSTVTVVGVVSGEIWAYGSVYYIQDGTGPWNGVMVYDSGRENAYGDSIRITAVVDEYYGMTELVDVSAYEVLATGATVEPSLVTTGEIGTDGANAEAYEGVLVQVKHVTITNPDLGYGEWEIDDDSGPVRVDDAADYYFTVANYDSVRSITGPLNYAFGDTKIEPRIANDVVEASEFTRIQRVQQVRYSDLLKTPSDEVSDHSYLNGETVTLKGIVTMPTGLSWAGAGIKFIFSELEGGPWSGILSYDPDSTAFPILLEGDVIKATGYIAEYHPGAGGNMTEFFITSAVEFIDIGQPLPDPDFVNTGDLRLPITAEQWGTGMVYVKNAKVVDLTPQYELFEVDDGSGGVLVDADSDSLTGYPDPPMGSIADSIRGWVYHHYGVYADSTTYKLEPLYTSDIVWGGGGPPALSNPQRNPGVPTTSDAVTVSVDVETELTITGASIYYRVNNGDYSTVPMSAEGGTYSGEIPAQELGSWVDYYFSVTDDHVQMSTIPSDLDVLNLSYPVTDGVLSIYDLQYTPWEKADTPFEGVEVQVTGVFNGELFSLNQEVCFPIQDDDGNWNGVYVFAEGLELNYVTGDEVKVTGIATDYNPAWSFMFDNNTVILAESIEKVSEGNSNSHDVVATSVLNSDSSDVIEAYEGTLVEIRNATLTSINGYDVSFDDGSGPCLVDDDVFVEDGDPGIDYFPVFYVGEDFLYAWGDTIRVGDQIDVIKGCFVYSFGTYKIEVGMASDFGTVTGVETDFGPIPLTYKLKQNYPNPFNPETRIYFEIPQAHDVTIAIYNMLGQKIRTLVKENFKAGSHVVNWNGQNDHGLQVPTGMYIYRIKAGEFMAAKKMVMIK
jgi:hypothetical protein